MSDRQVVLASNRQVGLSVRPKVDVVFSFEQLDVYQAARAFKKRVLALARLLPEEERYRLKLQMRKASLSLTNAISEGHGRYTYKDKRHYCHEARGSLQELVDDVNDCMDQNYAKVEHLQDLRHDAFRVLQLIDGWARWLAAQNAKQSAAKSQPSLPSRAKPARTKNVSTPQEPNDSTTTRPDDLTT